MIADHLKSFSLAHLTQLVASMPGWISEALTKAELDLKGGGGYSTQRTEKLLEDFDKNAAPDTYTITAGPSLEDLKYADSSGVPHIIVDKKSVYLFNGSWITPHVEEYPWNAACDALSVNP